jgi:dipeptidyl aminopeptidase/acylaminoacyl peptidase
LWIVPTSGGQAPRRLTAGPRDLSPRWSPDGLRLAFVRPVEKDGRRQAQIHLLAMLGGEAQAITDLPRGAGAPVWSPDGRRLAFTSSTRPDELEPAKKREGVRESDVRVITRAVYRSNGGGYAEPARRSAVWVVDVADASQASPRRLTDGAFDEGNVTWAPDGTKVYFTSNRVAEPYYQPQDTDLYAVPADGGPAERVLSIDGVIGRPVFSPDGKRVAFRGAFSRPIRSYTQSDLFIADATPGAAPRNLTERYDFDIAAGLTGDQHAPRGSQPNDPVWAPNGSTVLVTTTVHGRLNLTRFDASTGAATAVTTGNHEIVSATVSRDGTRGVVLLSTPTRIGDLFALDPATGRLTQLTRVNDTLFGELELTEPDDVWFTSFDGLKVHTLVQKPPRFDPSRRYPLILNIHGGPHAAYGYTFDHEFQWMAAKGYIVVYPNPRGSTSYGQEFGNVIQHRYPGDDAKDLLAAVDEVIKRGYVDTTKLGVTGGSGGGVLTNWIVTQTDRFAAAVSQRSIADWAGFWYTADFTLFQPTWFKAAPWEDPKDFAARSAITFVDRVKTPLMLVEGEDDLRTPPSDGGEQMFRALKYLERPVVMVRFPGETHELSRSGQPWHRIERLQHIVNWFDKWLLGAAMPQYEVK